MIARGWRQGRWFAVALLLALASALVPALCSSGPPASRATGSAFDPTTSVVALRGRTLPVVLAGALPDDGSGSGPTAGPSAVTPEPATAIALAAAARSATIEPIWTQAPPAGLRHLAHARPRAPPAVTA